MSSYFPFPNSVGYQTINLCQSFHPSQTYLPRVHPKNLCLFAILFNHIAFIHPCFYALQNHLFLFSPNQDNSIFLAFKPTSLFYYIVLNHLSLAFVENNNVSPVFPFPTIFGNLIRSISPWMPLLFGSVESNSLSFLPPIPQENLTSNLLQWWT